MSLFSHITFSKWETDSSCLCCLYFLFQFLAGHCLTYATAQPTSTVQHMGPDMTSLSAYLWKVIHFADVSFSIMSTPSHFLQDRQFPTSLPSLSMEEWNLIKQSRRDLLGSASVSICNKQRRDLIAFYWAGEAASTSTLSVTALRLLPSLSSDSREIDGGETRATERWMKGVRRHRGRKMWREVGRRANGCQVCQEQGREEEEEEEEVGREERSGEKRLGEDWRKGGGWREGERQETLEERKSRGVLIELC